MPVEKISIVVDAVDKATASVRKIGKDLEGTVNSLAQSTDGKIASIGQAFESNRESIERVGAASGIAFAAVGFGISQSISAASELNNSLTGLRSIVEGTGNDFDKAKAVIQRFTADGLVSTEQAATSLKNLIAKGFSLDQAEQMMLRFKDASAFGRQAALGLGEAIAGATEGIKNENSMLVDNAGVTKNVSVMIAEYAKAHGLKETALTAAQKNEAVYQGIIKETQFQVGDAAKLTQEYSGQVAKLNAQKLQLSQTVGTILMPALSSLMASITPIVATVAAWVKEHPKLTQAIVLWTLAVTGLGTALLVVGPIVSAITAALGILTAAAGALGTALAFLAANPIGLTLAALALLAGALFAVYKNWDTVKPMITGYWQELKSAISGTVDAISYYIGAKFEEISNKVTAAIDTLKKKAQAAKEYVASIMESAKSAATNALSSVGQKVNSAVSSVTGARALWGPVDAGRTYLVGEHGPELFTAERSGTVIRNGAFGGGSTSIQISLGWVVVQEKADIDHLVNRLSEELARKMELYRNLWIS